MIMRVADNCGFESSALVVLPDANTLKYRDLIATLAASHR
jgi:hypothetical protein